MKTIKKYLVILFLFLFINNVMSQDNEKLNNSTPNIIYGQGYKITKHLAFKGKDVDYLFAISSNNKTKNLSNNLFIFNHIALSVKNIDQSATFYREVLQLQEIKNRTKMDGIRWFSLGDGKELHLIPILKEPVTINKAVHFALSTSNFDAFIKNLDKMKVTFSDWSGTPNKINIRVDGIKQIYFQDPDGYWIEVNSVD